MRIRHNGPTCSDLHRIVKNKKFLLLPRKCTNGDIAWLEKVWEVNQCVAIYDYCGNVSFDWKTTYNTIKR